MSKLTSECFKDMLHSIHYISRTLERIETVLNDIKYETTLSLLITINIIVYLHFKFMIYLRFYSCFGKILFKIILIILLLKIISAFFSQIHIHIPCIFLD